MKRPARPRIDQCFPDCIAAMLELPAEAVPHFTSADGDAQCAQAQRWLERKHCLTLVTILCPHGSRLCDILASHARPVRFIAVVPVDGGKSRHSVVGAVYGERLRTLYDPGGWGRIRLSLANEIRLIVPLFKRGIPWRPKKSTAA